MVIPRLERVLPGVKVLVMLRNPVDRAFSQYQMCVDVTGTDEQKQARGLSSCVGKTFEQVVADEIEELQRLGITVRDLLTDSLTQLLHHHDDV